MYDCDLRCRRHPAGKCRCEVVAALNNRNHCFRSLAFDLLSCCDSDPGETQTITKPPEPRTSSSAKNRECYVAAVEKVHSLRMFYARLRSDHRQTIRRMFVQQSSDEDGATMMVRRWEFPNEEQSGSPCCRRFPFTTYCSADITRNELLNFEARIFRFVGSEVVDTAHPVSCDAKAFFQAVGVLMVKVPDRLGNVDQLVLCCHCLRILIPNQ